MSDFGVGLGQPAGEKGSISRPHRVRHRCHLKPHSAQHPRPTVPAQHRSCTKRNGLPNLAPNREILRQLKSRSGVDFFGGLSVQSYAQRLFRQGIPKQLQ
jgi:hypothetical protein